MKAYNYTFFPTESDLILKHYKRHLASFWTSEEINYEFDKKEWDKLGEHGKQLIKMTLAFFAASDGLVNENINMNFSNEVNIKEAGYFYHFQAMIEDVHSEVYSKLLDLYVKDHSEKDLLFKAIETVPIIQKKANWMKKWMNRDIRLVDRLFAFSCVEGVFFSSSFAAIEYTKEICNLETLLQSNELIRRDEMFHYSVTPDIVKELVTKKGHKPLSMTTCKNIILSAFELEKEFALESLKYSMLGMSSELMISHIKAVCNIIFKSFFDEDLFKNAKTFDFMETFSLDKTDNFFEKKSTAYKKLEVDENNKYNIDFNIH